MKDVTIIITTKNFGFDIPPMDIDAMDISWLGRGPPAEGGCGLGGPPWAPEEGFAEG
jgi:hypothetical protein